MKKKLIVYDVSMAAIFAAIISIFSQISLPAPNLIPTTFQTFAISLCAYTLTAKQSILAVVIYLLLGAVGLPVFSMFGGGLGVLFGFTGGFLWGFLAMTGIIQLSKLIKTSFFKMCIGIIALAVCHLFGLLQFCFVTQSKIAMSFLVVCLPYIVKDLLLLFAGYFTAKTVNKRFNIKNKA